MRVLSLTEPGDLRVELSIVTTMYRSTGYVDEFYERVVEAAEAVTRDFEVVFVNDGCPEGSREKALALMQGDERVRVVDLSRNFGHHQAMFAGLEHARGRHVFLIDCDLEEDPEVLVRFYDVLSTAQHADVVFGVQSERQDRLDRRVAAGLFYSVFNAIAEHPLPRNLLTVRLMTRRYVDALLQFEERDTQIAGLWELTGFERIPVPLVKRAKGGSTYSFGRRLAHLINAVTSFSARPLVFLFYAGVAIMLLAAGIAALFIYRKIVHGIDTEGFAALIVAVSFFGGLTVAAQGVIGIYIAKIFIETKKRPRTIVRAVHGDR